MSALSLHIESTDSMIQQKVQLIMLHSVLIKESELVINSIQGHSQDVVNGSYLAQT